jgi:hypothetical protein
MQKMTHDADGAERRRDAWRGDADRVRDRALTDASARRSRRDDQEQVGVVVEFVAARRSEGSGQARGSAAL